MKLSFVLVLASLISITFVNAARADEESEHIDKNVQKVLKQLDSIDINDPDVRHFVSNASRRQDDKGYNLIKQDIPTGQLSFRIQTVFERTPYSINQQRTQLVYTPDFNEHVNLVGARNGVILNYGWKF